MKRFTTIISFMLIAVSVVVGVFASGTPGGLQAAHAATYGITSAQVTPQWFMPGESATLTVQGNAFGTTPGHLYIIDPATGIVSSDITGSVAGSWDLTWSDTAIQLNVYPAVTQTYPVGSHTVDIRVKRADQALSLAASVTYTVGSAATAPSINFIQYSPSTVIRGDYVNAEIRGVNLGTAPGHLEFFDQASGNMLSDFTGSLADNWDLTWSDTVIYLKIYPQVTGTYDPGSYVADLRVTRADQAPSNKLMVQYTVTQGSSPTPLPATPSPIAGGSACHRITTASQVPEGYGAPYDVQYPGNLLLKATCSSESVTLDIGDNNQNTYIYKGGYVYTPITPAWTQITFSGSNLIADNWYTGKAQFTASVSDAQLAQPNYYAAYTCKWTGTKWMCGCRDSACTQSYWQIQKVQR